MAVLHHATLSPTKLELLRALVGSRPWGQEIDPAGLAVLGAYRFDDPDGEVGLETFLVAGADGAVLQLALTYRGAPLAGAADALVAVADHSVLGSRWVYDGTADEVYTRALLATMTDGGQQAGIAFSTDAGLVPHELATFVRGRPGSAETSREHPVLLRHVRPGHDTAPAGAPSLWGTWPGQDAEALLAWVAADPS